MLAFEGAGGLPDLVSGKAFATKLKDLRSLGVVVLNACNTARAGQRGANPFRGVATALVHGGVPAVVAMQRPITDRAAIGFSTAFYRHLARGDSIDEALTEGRQAVHSAKPEGFEWATPVLFLRIPDGNVFVARPVSSPEAVKPPASALMEASIAVPPSAPISPRRGLVVKMATGVAGAGLVAFVLYTKIPRTSSPPSLDDGHTGTGNVQLTTDTPAQPKEDNARKGSTRKADKTHPAAAGIVSGKKESDGAPAETQQKITSSFVPPPAPQPSLVTTEAKAPADLSSLSAQAVSITRRDSGGLRVTVRFKNSSDRPLSVALDSESSILSDNQGLPYSIMDSDTGPDPHFSLAPGSSSEHIFDFQAPKVGSKQFTLALAAEGGRSIKISGALMSLP